MPTFKTIVISNTKRADKTYNVRIRVTHNRKNTSLSTQWYVTAADLTSSLNLKTQYYKDLAEDKIREYRKICDNTRNIQSLTLAEVVDLLKGVDNQNGVKLNITGSMSLDSIVDTLKNKPQNNFKLDIIAYLNDECTSMMKLGRKKEKSAKARQTVANSLQKFIKKDTLDVNELTTKFVESYIDWLKGDDEKYTRKCSAYPGVISKALDDIKYKYNDEESGTINVTVNPFEKIKQSRRNGTRKQQFVKPKKRPSLTIEQIQEIINIKTFDSKREELSRDMFLLSFMLIGMNSVDLYTCTKYNKDKKILTYNREKVEDRREDDGEMQIKIEPEVLPLFEKYKNLNCMKKEVFCFCNRYATSGNFNKAINAGLKPIGKKKKIGISDLQYYSARRSWERLLGIT
jgi:hypothetical protein